MFGLIKKLSGDSSPPKEHLGGAQEHLPVEAQASNGVTQPKKGKRNRSGQTQDDKYISVNKRKKLIRDRHISSARSTSMEEGEIESSDEDVSDFDDLSESCDGNKSRTPSSTTSTHERNETSCQNPTPTSTGLPAETPQVGCEIVSASTK